MKKILALSIVAASAAAFSSTAHAALLSLATTTPDVFADNGVATLTITAGTRTLTLSGITERLTTLANGTQNLSPTGTFTAVINLALNGTTTGANETFNILSGSIIATGNGVTEFSSITPTAFGFTSTTGSNVAADFQILYSSATGASATVPFVDIIYHASTAIPNYGTNFLDVPFSTNAIVPVGSADIFVPEPTSLALLGLTAPVMLRRRRKA